MCEIDTGVMVLLGYLFAGIALFTSAWLSYRHRTLTALVYGLIVGWLGWVFFAYVIPAVINFGHLLAGR